MQLYTTTSVSRHIHVHVQCTYIVVLANVAKYIHFQSKALIYTATYRAFVLTNAQGFCLHKTHVYMVTVALHMQSGLMITSVHV